MNINKQSEIRDKLFHLVRRVQSQLLYSRVKYFDDSLKSLSGVKEVGLNRRCVIILGHKHYYVRSKSYPIDNKKELLQVLALEECDFPQCDTLLFNVRNIEEGKALVDFWEYSSSIYEIVGENHLLVPASFIQAQSNLWHKKVISIANTLFYQVDNRISRTTQKNTLLAFSMLGLESETEVEVLSENEYFSTLAGELFRLSTLSYKQLFQRYRGVPKCNLSRVALFAFSAALISFSGLYAFSEHQLSIKKAELDSLSNQLNTTFALKKQSESLAANYQELISTLPQENVSSVPYWEVMADMYALKAKQNIRVRFHRFQNGVFTISLITDSATEILKHLHADRRVKIEQRGDTAKGRDGEIVTIDITLVKTEKQEKTAI